MSPLRMDVVVTGFVLAIPLFLLALRGDFTAEEVVTRLPWCFAAAWGAVAVIRFASTPPPPKKPVEEATAPADDRTPTG